LLTCREVEDDAEDENDFRRGDSVPANEGILLFSGAFSPILLVLVVVLVIGL
jgi:hypothetical protein